MDIPKDPTKAEFDFAQALLQNHTLDDVKFIIDFGIDQADIDKFNMQTLGGIKQYLSQAEEALKRHKEDKVLAEHQAKIAQARKKEEEEKRKQEEAEAQKLDAIFDSLNPSQKAEIEKEAEQRLNKFEKRFLERDRKQGQISELTKLSLDIKVRKVLKDWLSSGQIKIDQESSA